MIDVAEYYFVYRNTQFGPQREGGFETLEEVEDYQRKMTRKWGYDTWIVREPLYCD